MKKILLAADFNLLENNVLDNAIQLAKSEDALLVGVFIQDLSLADYYTILGGEPVFYEHAYTLIKEELNENEQKIINLINKFVEICKEAKVKFKVHFNKGMPLEELLEESKFADVFLIGFNTYKGVDLNINDQELVKRLLSKSRCPVILLPEKQVQITSYALCFDGSENSLAATRAFLNTFSAKLENSTVFVLQVLKSSADEPESTAPLVEWLRMFNCKIELINLFGNPKDELLYFAKQHPGTLLVMGAYGKSGLSRFFYGSTADHVLNSGTVPTLIFN
jgi:nucleotide-binding universal stress UspA family protein